MPLHLLADLPADLPQLVERYGSFALIAVGIVWGGPKLLSFLREQRQDFTAAIKEARTDHAKTISELVAKHESRQEHVYETHAAWQKETNGVLTQLVSSVRDLADRHDARPPPRG